MHKKIFRDIGLCAALLLSSNLAHAVAISDATGSLDWTSFSISGTEGTDWSWGSFMYNGVHSYAESSLAAGINDSVSNNDRTTPLSGSTTNHGMIGAGTTNSSIVESSGYANAVGTGPTDGRASASTHRGRYISFGEVTSLVFSVDYSVKHLLSRGSLADDSANAYSEFNFYLTTAPGGDRLFSDRVTIYNSLSDQLSLQDITAGTLSFVVDVPGLAQTFPQQQYWMEAQAYTSAGASTAPTSSVPAPGTLALIGAGLIGAGISRRRGRVLRKPGSGQNRRVAS